MDAQIRLSKAFELKESVATLETNRDALASGSVTDKDALEKISQDSEAANEAHNKSMKEGKELSKEGTEHYINSYDPFVKGIKGTRDLALGFPAFLSAAQNQIKNAPTLDMRKVKKKLSASMYVATNTPGLIGNMLETSKQMLAYTKARNIPVPKNSTDALGDL